MKIFMIEKQNNEKGFKEGTLKSSLKKQIEIKIESRAKKLISICNNFLRADDKRVFHKRYEHFECV